MIALVNIFAFILIGLIIWWFWLEKPKALKAGSSPIDVVVDNGVYEPSHIEVSRGEPVTLRFIRKDAGPCAEKVIFESLDQTYDLPFGKPLDVKLQLDIPGEYPFTCQMKMYQGSLLVK